MSAPGATGTSTAVSSEAMKALQSMRVPVEPLLPEGRLYVARRVSTTVDGYPVGRGPVRRSVDLSVVRRVSLSQALAAVSSRSHSTITSSPGETGLSTRSDGEEAIVPSPLRSSRDHDRAPQFTGAAPGGVAERTSTGPTFAQKFKRRVDALGTLNERGAGLSVPARDTPPSTTGRPAPQPTTNNSSSPVQSDGHALLGESSKTAMQLFFEAEDGRNTVQRPGDFRRRVHLTNPTQWQDDMSSSDSDEA